MCWARRTSAEAVRTALGDPGATCGPGDVFERRGDSATSVRGLLVDRFARDPQSEPPKDARAVLGDPSPDGWLSRLMETAAVEAETLLAEFLGQFGDHLSPDAVAGLQAWAGPPPERRPER